MRRSADDGLYRQRRLCRVGAGRPRLCRSLVGLPPGDFALPIFDVVLNAKTVRGSIVGTRKDLQEALEFAGEGKAHTVCTEDSLDNINTVLDRMRNGDIEGRVVMRMAGDA